MSWEGLTTESHLGAIHTRDMSIEEIKDMYGPKEAEKASSVIDDMKAYQYHYDIMQHKMELELQKERERSARETPFGSTLGIMEQIEDSNRVPHEPMTVASMEQIINDLIKDIGKEERQFTLFTGEGGMKEFDRNLKSTTREDWTVEDWKEQLSKEMKL